MKVSKNLITPARPFVYSGPLDVSLFSPRPGYGVKEIKTCEVEAEVFVEEDEYSPSPRLFAYVSGKATLVRIDSRNLEEYEEEAEIDDEVEILSSLLDEGEGYVFPERTFELEELVFAMILTDLPPARRDSTSLPDSGEGYEVYEQGEENDQDMVFVSPEDDKFE